MQKRRSKLGGASLVFALCLPLTTFAAYPLAPAGNTRQETELATVGSNSPQSAQPKHTVTGVVLDESGQPIIGASIVVKGNPRTGAVTDVNGQFSINVSNTDDVLVFTYIGYQKKEVAIKGKKILSVTMKEDTKTLNDVVVTAFGATQKKETVVGSIQQVKPENLRVPGANISTAFAGRLSGVIATQSSGMPGSNGANFYIRGISTISGATSPLIVMDGMEISQDDLNHLDPDVIESFSILKDASATAMYGTRGANGVLIITTKSGQDLEKPKITFRVEGNITMPTSKPKFVDGARFMELFNEAVQNEGTGSTLYTQEQIEATRNHVNPYVFPDVNWYDEIFKNAAFNQKANMNIRGGTRKIVYFMNLNVSHETGMIRNRSKEFFSYNNNINYTRYAFQNNIDFNMTKSSKISLHLYAGLDDMHGPLAGSNTSNSISGSMNDIYAQVVNANPVLFPIYYENPNGDEWVHWGFRALANGGNYNPMARLVSGYQDSFASTITANLNFDQKLDFITKGLGFHAMFSFKNWSKSATYRTMGYNQYQLENYTKNDDGTYSYETSPVGDPTKPTLTNSGENFGDRRYYAQAYFDYNRTFGNHTVSAMLLWNINSYSSNLYTTNVLGSLPQRKMGFAARATYDYLHRYLLEFNAGYNGSEQFASGHRWGFFPSIGVGYVISEEKFWDPIKDVISNLKLRGTYGLVGNDQYGGARFIYREDVALTGKGSFTTGIPGNFVSYSGPGWNRLQNNNITWEVGHKLDLGFDLQLFHDLSITFDWFRERRSDIFQQKLSIPNYLGTADTKIYGNLAEVVNHGVDLAVSYNKVINKDLSIQFQGTLTWNNNKVTVYDEAPGTREAMKMKGKNVKTVWGYIADGLYIDDADIANSPKSTLGNIAIAPGDVKYVDQPDNDGNYDGKITSDDRVPIGTSIPKLIYGFGPSVAYKNWDFSVFFQGRGNVALVLSDIQPFGASYRRGVLKFVDEDHWSPNNQDPNAKYPRLTDNYNNNNTATSTYWLRNGRFLKLKNAEIGYSYKNFRFYVNGTNLLTFSPFKKWDPEMGGGNYTSKYPTQMTVNVGLQISIN
ncbi:MAG: TonB-dependent receptor [Prevotella sp.]|jgi:TonB-linked SusC/RagA family outer membrane protein|nr:TonB-dependent receptor [Prevotella sp.]MCI2080113.1 TonB-dependent receptor [Prevotella sp.]MCI2101871.1 TonB-dependent receptor [Prevotella sp.]